MIENLVRAVFSLNFNRFVTPTIIAGVYFVESMVLGAIALIIEMEAIFQIFGHSIIGLGTMPTGVYQLTMMQPAWAVVVACLLPLVWLPLQVVLRVQAELIVALIKIAENTSPL